MRMTAWSWGVAGLAVFALLVAACGDQGATGPTTEEFSKEREALQARIAKGARGKAKKQKIAKAQPGAGKGATKNKGGFGQIERDYAYDPTGKRDPFRNFKWERPDRLDVAEITTPLEQYDLGQLTLVAVVWKTGNARALIQDPSGESYIIGEGAKIGKNSGWVKLIQDGLVVVTETYADHLGQETVKDVEMHMRRNEGG